MGNVYFIADTHFFHKGKMDQYPSQPFPGPQDPDAYDQWLEEYWNKIVEKDDKVYIVGDFAYGTTGRVKDLVNRLKGEKYLVTGNHDESALQVADCFRLVRDVMDISFRISDYSFLQEDFLLFLCHYPVISWNGKKKGSCMVHGHCHGRIDSYNTTSGELRVDVGINAALSRSCGGLIPLEKLYFYFRQISGGITLREYTEENKGRLLI